MFELSPRRASTATALPDNHAGHSPHTNLPLALTTFVGRTEEMMQINTRLDVGGVVTLIGAGGIGKTRLALQVGWSLVERYSDGVWWIDLATLHAATLLPQAIAAALQVQERADESTLDTLVRFLAHREVLLLLDNCEHLVDACAALAKRLLQTCPGLQILATSREALRVDGELVYSVPPLSLPEPEETQVTVARLASFGAVRLFVERARQVDPTFAITAENGRAVLQICTQLDGIPLAIELAAARLSVLSVEQITAHLTDVMRLLAAGNRTDIPRHHTMRAALDWSYHLLAPQEQTLVQRLSLFAASFTLSAAEAVAGGDGIDVAHILDLITQLFNKSWLVAKLHEGEMRYRLLEPVRQYCAEKLRLNGAALTWQLRHAQWALALAERMEPILKTGQQTVALKALALEHDNLRAALTRSLAHGSEPLLGVHLALALFRYWWMSNHVEEARYWFALALNVPMPTARLRIRVLNATGFLAWWQGDYEKAQTVYQQSFDLSSEHELDDELAVALEGLGDIATAQGDSTHAAQLYQRSLSLRRRHGDSWGIAMALLSLGKLLRRQRDYANATVSLEESRTLFAALGDRHCLLAPLMNLTGILRDQGEYTRADGMYQECFDLAQTLGDQSNLAWVLTAWGENARRTGELTRASQLMDEGFRLYRELGEQHSMALTVERKGLVARSMGDVRQAETLIAESRQLYRQLGDKLSLAWALHNLSVLARNRRDVVQACTLAVESYLHFHGQNEPFGAGAALAVLAGLWVDQGQWLLATHLLAAADRLLGERAMALYPEDRQAYDDDLAAARSHLSQRAFGAAWAEGASLAAEALLTRLQQMKEQCERGPLPTAGMQPSGELSTITAPPPEGVTVFALGTMRVLYHGRELTMKEWGYTHAKALFFYLLTYPDATREVISSHFWPADADAADQAEPVRRRFATVLGRARKALGGTSAIVQVEKHYSLNPTLVTWFDVEQFETGLKRAQQWQRSSLPAAPAETLRTLTATVALYHGDFLADLVDQSWHLARRAALREHFLNALLALGQLHLAAGDSEQALAVYQQALASDACLEEAHQAVMTLYARQGDRKLALRQYAALVQALRDELDVSPATASIVLAERIRRGEAV